MWVDGHLKGGLLILNTSEACWIAWSIVMSPGGRTSADETWFMTCAGTLDGSWPTNRGWCVTCRSGFWDSTNMFRPFPDLLLRSCLLPQQMWLLPSWSLLSMSLPQQHRGHQVPDEEPWRHSDRYIRWFYRVSHPIIVNPPLEPEITMSRHVYHDVLVDQDWGRHPPDPRQVLSTMRDRAEHAFQILEVVSNPLFLGILEGLRSDYIVFDQQPVPRRRSRSPHE